MRCFSKVLIFICLSTLLCWSAHASESSTYAFKWLDPDKEVYVLQNRKFRKVGKLYLNLGLGKTTSGAFADATHFQARAGFFFKEDWGFEVLYTSTSSDTNDTFESVEAQNAIPFVRKVTGYMGGMLLWSPFYAKINTFNTIFYFDWIFGLGFASLDEENNKNALNANDNTLAFTAESHTGIMWDVGMRFYINKTWSMRVDLTAINYKATKALANTTEEAYYDNYDLTFSASFTF